MCQTELRLASGLGFRIDIHTITNTMPIIHDYDVLTFSVAFNKSCLGIFTSVTLHCHCVHEEIFKFCYAVSHVNI